MGFFHTMQNFEEIVVSHFMNSVLKIGTILINLKK